VDIGSTYKPRSAYGRFGLGNQQPPSALRVRTERGRLWSRTSAKSSTIALRNIATVFRTEDTNAPYTFRFCAVPYIPLPRSSATMNRRDLGFPEESLLIPKSCILAVLLLTGGCGGGEVPVGPSSSARETGSPGGLRISDYGRF